MKQNRHPQALDREPELAPMAAEPQCAFCGEPIPNRRADCQYCSSRCRAQASFRRRLAAAAETQRLHVHDGLCRTCAEKRMTPGRERELGAGAVGFAGCSHKVPEI